MNQSPTWLFRQSLVIPEPGGAHIYQTREVQQAVDRSRLALIAILDAGQQDGSFRPVDSERVAMAINALLHAFLRRQQNGEEPGTAISRDRFCGDSSLDEEFVADFIEHGLGKDSLG